MAVLVIADHDDAHVRDTTNKTITVKCKDDQGKETEKTFKLAEDIRYLDSTGKVAAIECYFGGKMSFPSAVSTGKG